MRRYPLALFACLFLAASVATIALAQEECEATVEANINGEQQADNTIIVEFAVEVDTTAACAQIEFDLIIEEQLPNGHLKRIRKPQFVKLNDGHKQHMVKHHRSQDLQMVSYEAKLVECKPCDIER